MKHVLVIVAALAVLALPPRFASSQQADETLDVQVQLALKTTDQLRRRLNNETAQREYLESRVQALEERVRRLEALVVGLPVKRAAQGLPDHETDAWYFILHEIVPADTTALLEEASALEEQAVKMREDVAEMEYNARQRVNREIAAMERRARALRAQAQRPGLTLRGEDARGRTVLCALEPRKAGLAASLKPGNMVRVRGALDAATSEEIRMAGTFVERYEPSDDPE